MDEQFYRGKNVFITGHTGFKGSMLSKILLGLGARVTGYALTPPTEPALFDLLHLNEQMTSIEGDVCDFESLSRAMQSAQPEIVFHLAAQPIVREGFRAPRKTFETNVLGTVNLLEAVRRTGSVKSVLNVTTDKVYQNEGEFSHAFREEEPLCGADPYSNSKSCSELVTACYRNSFLRESGVRVSTARAGNVIGGGDFAPDRILPDCVRAAARGEKIFVRNPASVRPYQHVLEPLFLYLTIAARQIGEGEKEGSYNVGPDECDCLSTGELATLFCESFGCGAAWETRKEQGAPKEASYLRLDNSKAKAVFGWRPRLSVREAVELTVRWTKVYLAGGDVARETEREIGEYLSRRA